MRPTYPHKQFLVTREPSKPRARNAQLLRTGGHAHAVEPWGPRHLARGDSGGGGVARELSLPLTHPEAGSLPQEWTPHPQGSESHPARRQAGRGSAHTLGLRMSE